MQVAYATKDGGENDEFRSRCFVEKWPDGLKEYQGPERVRFEMLVDFSHRRFDDRTVVLGDASDCDDEIKVGNAEFRPKSIDNVASCCMGQRIVLHNDKLGIASFGKRVESFGSVMGGIPDCSDGNGVGTGNVSSEETLADTCGLGA